MIVRGIANTGFAKEVFHFLRIAFCFFHVLDNLHAKLLFISCRLTLPNTWLKIAIYQLIRVEFRRICRQVENLYLISMASSPRSDYFRMVNP